MLPTGRRGQALRVQPVSRPKGVKYALRGHTPSVPKAVCISAFVYHMAH